MVLLAIAQSRTNNLRVPTSNIYRFDGGVFDHINLQSDRRCAVEQYESLRCAKRRDLLREMVHISYPGAPGHQGRSATQ